MIKRKSRYYLEKSLRRFIHEGVMACLPYSDEVQGFLPKSSVIMANDSVRSPDGLFATLQYVGESRSSPYFYQKGEELWVQQAIHAKYLVCFLRSYDPQEGNEQQGDRVIYSSYDVAQAFVDFVESYRGMGWASNAVTDGKLHKVYVYQTSDDGRTPAGAKVDYEVFNNNPDTYDIKLPYPTRQVWSNENAGLDDVKNGERAKVRLYASSNGKIESGFIVDTGYGYSMGQEVEIPSDWESINGNNNWPTVTAVGSGFTVDNQLMIEEDDYPRDDQTVERRCMIEMDISFLENRKEEDVNTVSRYEMDVKWIQKINHAPDKLELQQGGESKLLAISMKRQPASNLKVLFDISGDFIINNRREVEGSDVLPVEGGNPYIIITPEDWNAPRYVKVAATTTADTTSLHIYTESIGRSEDNVSVNVPVVITPA